MPQLSLENFARVTAIVSYQTIQLTLLANYPEISAVERQQLTIDIIAQMARRAGCEVRKTVFKEADGE